MQMRERVRTFFSEGSAPRSIFFASLALHLLFFSLLVFNYGPYSFFLSSDGSLSNNDTQHYVVIAKNLAEGNGYSRFPDAPFEPDALRTPLLPLYFVTFLYLGGLSLVWLAILLLQFLLALTPVVLYKIARQFLSHEYSLIAALALAAEPIFLYRSQIAEPDALLVFFLIIATYCIVSFWERYGNVHASDRYWYAACAVLGISILAKPTAQYVTVLFFIAHTAFLFFFHRKIGRADAKNLIFGALLILLILSPWLFRNHRVFGVWGMSSIATYNLYDYYTGNIKMSGETIPEYIQIGSREPSRYLPYESFFMSTAVARIKARPIEYGKEQAIGSLRNLFVSDLPAIYYYGHTKILPFSYNPESKTNLHELLARGDFAALSKALIFETSLKLLWVAALCAMYVLCFVALFSAWRKDRLSFFVFLFFGLLFAYFVIVSGPYVDAKYRLPALPLLFTVALYGIEVLIKGAASKSGTQIRRSVSMNEQ